MHRRMHRTSSSVGPSFLHDALPRRLPMRRLLVRTQAVRRFAPPLSRAAALSLSLRLSPSLSVASQICRHTVLNSSWIITPRSYLFMRRQFRDTRGIRSYLEGKGIFVSQPEAGGDRPRRTKWNGGRHCDHRRTRAPLVPLCSAPLRGFCSALLPAAVRRADKDGRHHAGRAQNEYVPLKRFTRIMRQDRLRRSMAVSVQHHADMPSVLLAVSY